MAFKRTTPIPARPRPHYPEGVRALRDEQANIVYDLAGELVTNPRNSLKVLAGVIHNVHLPEAAGIPMPPESAAKVGELALRHESRER